MMKKVTGLILAAMFATLSTSAIAGNGPEGVWTMVNRKVTVKVAYCGGENLCATIVGLLKPLNKAGKPKVDQENPNPSLRTRPIIGLMVMNGMRPAGQDAWKGKIYNADEGATYRSFMKLNGDSMVVKGCWGPFCKDMKFVRVN